MPDAGVKEAVRFYAKQLKLPTFANVEEAAGRFRRLSSGQNHQNRSRMAQ